MIECKGRHFRRTDIHSKADGTEAVMSTEPCRSSDYSSKLPLGRKQRPCLTAVLAIPAAARLEML